MKNLFQGYYQLDEDEFVTLWESSIFIFDTNVLLNLYRYQTSTRDSLFEVMEKLDGRVWVPYHVGLEFQRNRLSEISIQKKRFAEVRDLVNKSVSGLKNKFDTLELKKRHSHIDPDPLIAKFNDIKSEFFE